MAEGRVTQAPALALVETTAAARATQAQALALVDWQTTAKASQVVALALVDFATGTKVTQTAALVLAAAVPCLTFRAQCWRIERQDGEVFTFTSHDVEQEFRGETYTPCASLSASALDLGAQAGDVGNMELAGIIDDDAISETALFNGDFDSAKVEVWQVPWSQEGGEAPRRLAIGVIGRVTQGRGSYDAEVLSPGVLLGQQPLLTVAQPGCDWELGDSRCAVDLGALTVTGTVTTAYGPPATGLDRRRRFTDSGRSEDDGYFDGGIVTWTGGVNSGARSKVKSFTGGDFFLWEAMLHPVTAGDTYTASPGCDRSKTMCQDKFDNYVNFGGLPDVPGKDSINQTPDAKLEGP